MTGVQTCALPIFPSLAAAPLQLVDVLDDPALRWLLGAGATVGIAVMALALVPSVARSGVRLRFRPDVRHPAVRSLTRMSAWTLGYVAAKQSAGDR